MSTLHSSTVHLPATDAAVLAVLIDAGRFASWNPALTHVDCPDPVAVTGAAYRATVRGVIPATFTYELIEPLRVVHRLAFRGFEELGEWELEPTGHGTTRVRHSFRQTGPVAALIPAGAAGVADLRTGRLRDEVQRRSSVG